MKDKLEVGIYVRTKWGYICKIININDFREPSMKYGVEASYLKDIMFIGDDDISKASHNIIDLIEVGDYVNGERVIGFGAFYYYDDGTIERTSLTLDKTVTCLDSEIKSIVTKEQFESMSYKVGDDK